MIIRFSIRASTFIVAVGAFLLGIGLMLMWQDAPADVKDSIRTGLARIKGGNL